MQCGFSLFPLLRSTDLTTRLASSMADAVEENVKPKTEEKPDDSGSEEDNIQPEVAEIEVALKTFKDLVSLYTGRRMYGTKTNRSIAVS